MTVAALERLARRVSELVALESVSPDPGEAAMAARLNGWLECAGCETAVVEHAPGRPSLAGILRGARRRPALVLNGHMDTVDVPDPQAWRHPPFAGRIEGGMVWGRGAADMKGGLVAQVACAELLAPLRDRMTGSLVLHFAAGEERAEPGTLGLLQAGFDGDWGIVCEPTDLAVATAARGAAWLSIRVGGRPVHAATSSYDENAIARLGPVLAALARYDGELRGRRSGKSPSPSCVPTVVAGGRQRNSAPAECTVVVDRRLAPGERVEDALRELRAVVPGAEVTLDGTYFEPAETRGESQVATALRRTLGRGPDGFVTPYASDVRNLVNDAGIDAVTFGPGQIAQAHATDEHVPVDHVREAALALARTALHLLTELTDSQIQEATK